MSPSPIALIAGLSLLHSTAAIVCTPTDIPPPLFDTSPGISYSCTSSGGGVNDLNSNPMGCAGDETGVYIEVTPSLGAECLQAHSECKIPMQNFTSMDYDFSVESCLGVWAAPLWMTPDTWQWGGGSGEIDSLEMCSRDSIHMNFAGGGNQIRLDEKKFDINDTDNAHVTVRKDEAGIVTISTCEANDLDTNWQCPAPTYDTCDQCLAAPDFACWCNNADNIYGSGGCVDGTDCLFTLVSDIWNGVSGDDGYDGCMTAVPALNLEAGKPNLNSKCKFSVENIVLRGNSESGALPFAEGSPDFCKKLTV